GAEGGIEVSGRGEPGPRTPEGDSDDGYEQTTLHPYLLAASGRGSTAVPAEKAVAADGRARHSCRTGARVGVGRAPAALGSAGMRRRLRRRAPSLPDLSTEEAVPQRVAEQLVIRVRLLRVGHGVVGDGSYPRISLRVFDERIPAGCATPSTRAKLRPGEKPSH